MDVLVIGCGVSGLTTGRCLQEAGHRVTIWARARPPHTTSNIAAAVWYPYLAEPKERVIAWGATAYQKFKALSADPATGVVVLPTMEPLDDPDPNGPWWRGAVDNFGHAAPDELPAGYQDGYEFPAPVIDTGVYLDYLVRAFEESAEQLGGGIVTRDVTDLAEAFAACPVVINCTGLGARELVGDHDLHASRGQVVRIKPNGFRRAIVDDHGHNRMAYIVPRLHDIVLGGIAEEYNESTEADPAVTEGILQRCAKLAPEFAKVDPADILNVVCGLRPVRSTVRVEAERPAPDRLLVHNYGHGGAGITLSWGCAAEAAALATA